MRFRETELGGVYIVELQKISDSRGFFSRAWCRDEQKHAGLAMEVAQCNISNNAKKGTLRGMHYQKDPYAEIKFVRCIHGAIYDVVLDLRKASPTYLKWIGVELSAANGYALHIPQGFAHGYQTLADASEIFYQVSEPYNPASEGGVRWDDPAFGIQWPNVTAPIISEKDRTWPDYIP
jgi:dTDP-4-dehydrorhamnose 3,5-epimerase